MINQSPAKLDWTGLVDSAKKAGFCFFFVPSNDRAAIKIEKERDRKIFEKVVVQDETRNWIELLGNQKFPRDFHLCI